MDWTRVERIAAILAIVSAASGLAVSIYSGGAIETLPLSLLGLLAGAMTWRGSAPGHAAALAFYGVQLAGYHSYDLAYAHPLRSTLSLAVVVHLPAGVLIVNVLALALFGASAALLWRRRGQGGLA